MEIAGRVIKPLAVAFVFAAGMFVFAAYQSHAGSDHAGGRSEAAQQSPSPIIPPIMISPPAAAKVEQTSQGTRAGATLVESFDGLGVGFEGPHGTATVRNPSDNSLAVGPNHVFQIVNTRMAIFTKKGKQYAQTGKVLYGPIATNTIFKGFGRACEATNNGDAVVRYDQLVFPFVRVISWIVSLCSAQRARSRKSHEATRHKSEKWQMKNMTWKMGNDLL